MYAVLVASIVYLCCAAAGPSTLHLQCRDDGRLNDTHSQLCMVSYWLYLMFCELLTLCHDVCWHVQMSNMGMPLAWSLSDSVTQLDPHFQVSAESCAFLLKAEPSICSSNPDCLQALHAQHLTEEYRTWVVYPCWLELKGALHVVEQQQRSRLSYMYPAGGKRN